MKSKIIFIANHIIAIICLIISSIIQLGIFDEYLLNHSYKIVNNEIVTINSWQYIVYSNKILIGIILITIGIGQWLICERIRSAKYDNIKDNESKSD